jgi:hypothetical protein
VSAEAPLRPSPPDATADERLAQSRAELESVLVERSLDPAFPRSRTMRALQGHAPIWLAGIAIGLMAVKPRWGARVLRLVPLARMLKRLSH